MTREEVTALSDEELRIKAAELAGWRYVSTVNWFGFAPGYEPKSESAAACPPVWCGRLGAKRVPDFPHDIAASFELESTVIDQRAYAKALNDIMFPLDGEVRVQLFYGAIECGGDADGEILPYTYAHASPRDRTRAFILSKEPHAN